MKSSTNLLGCTFQICIVPNSVPNLFASAVFMQLLDNCNSVIDPWLSRSSQSEASRMLFFLSNLLESLQIAAGICLTGFCLCLPLDVFSNAILNRLLPSFLLPTVVLFMIALVAWDSIINKLIYKIESLQYQSARFILNNCHPYQSVFSGGMCHLGFVKVINCQVTLICYNFPCWQKMQMPCALFLFRGFSENELQHYKIIAKIRMSIQTSQLVLLRSN